jgi:tetratricopeptide (TPR) repeat protein
MAKKGASHEVRADTPAEKLPEPLEEVRGLVNTGKQLYVWVRKRGGRVAAIAAVCGLVVIVIWWKWPELRERPGIEPLVEWFEQLTPIPTCSGHNFCVAVADLQNDSDNKFGGAIVDAVENLQDITSPQAGQGPSTGIEVIRIPRTLSTAGNKTRTAEANALIEARRYLEKSHADLVIWGVVISMGEKSAPRIFWTTSEANQRSNDLLNVEGFQLSEQFWHQLADMLQLVIVTRDTQIAAQEGGYVADKLLPFIEKVRALLPQTQGEGWTNDSRAQVKATLADSLRVYGEQAGDNAALREAIGYYQDVLQERTRERVPLDWATTQNNLGAALNDLGERESGNAQLQQAVAAYQQALLERTRERVPLDWAMTQNNLGLALARLGERESGTAHLQQAVAAFQQALLEWTRERVPLDWATTQNNLGAALDDLGERESGNAHLQQAVAAYQQALLERTRERVPLNWASTQNNLGAALTALGERESGTAHLQQAAAAYQEALLEYTRERVPLDWAATEDNLGNALDDLGERDKDPVQLCDALRAHTRAWKVFQGPSPYDASMALENTQQTLRIISKQTSAAAHTPCLTNQARVLEEMGLSTQQ